MVISADENFQHSIHDCLRSVEPIAVAKNSFRRRTLDNGDLFAPVLRMGQNEADRLPRIISQIMASRAQSTALNITQIAYVKSRPGCAIDDEETHRRFHSEVATEALKLRKSQLHQAAVPTGNRHPTF